MLIKLKDNSVHFQYSIYEFEYQSEFARMFAVSEEEASTRLVEFIHQKTGLLGTKTMCYEGGCGVCVVSATYMDHVLGKKKTISLNSVSKVSIKTHSLMIQNSTCLSGMFLGNKYSLTPCPNLNGSFI